MGQDISGACGQLVIDLGGVGGGATPLPVGTSGVLDPEPEPQQPATVAACGSGDCVGDIEELGGRWVL